MIRRLARWIGGAALLCGLGYGASFWWVWHVSRQDVRRPADAIVVLGAAQYNGHPSPVLRARLDHALILFRQRVAPVVVVTGGTAAGDAFSEAKVGHRYLSQRGVPDSAVIDRPEGRTTAASMEAVAEWARTHGVSRILLVSDPFHMARLLIEARNQHLDAAGSPTRTSPILSGSSREWSYLAWEGLKVPFTWLRSLGP